MTMVDDAWLRQNFPNAHVASMRDPVKVKGIASDCHTSNLYTVIKVFMPTAQGTENVLVELEMEVHLIKGLECHMLIGVDMLAPYAMSLDFDKCTLD